MQFLQNSANFFNNIGKIGILDYHILSYLNSAETIPNISRSLYKSLKPSANFLNLPEASKPAQYCQRFLEVPKRTILENRKDHVTVLTGVNWILQCCKF